MPSSFPNAYNVGAASLLFGASTISCFALSESPVVTSAIAPPSFVLGEISVLSLFVCASQIPNPSPLYIVSTLKSMLNLISLFSIAFFVILEGFRIPENVTNPCVKTFSAFPLPTPVSDLNAILFVASLLVGASINSL